MIQILILIPISGDGVTDDTAAINAAISSGNRCGQNCPSDTTTPAVVYFPSGTYKISYPIFDYYYTQIIGDPNNLPVIKGSSNFQGGYLIDADPYFSSDLNWASTVVFFRSIRNIVLDLRDIPAGDTVSGIHWPTAQATSLENVVFEMSSASGTKHQGLFIESGLYTPYPHTDSLILTKNFQVPPAIWVTLSSTVETLAPHLAISSSQVAT